MRDLDQVVLVENYISRITVAIEEIGYYPRALHRYPFDTIASSLMSKSVALAQSCILLLKEDRADEAYGLSRSVVECALILRYITSDPELQPKRSLQFAMFSFDYKNIWLHYARKQFAGQPKGEEIERIAKEWNLSGDPKKAKKHWSRLRAFTWDAQSLQHPLDGLMFDAVFREKQYTVDYFQTCQWVHCSQPALDNYVPGEGKPFRFRKSSGEFGSPGHSILYILLNYLHSVMCYALYGLGVPRPKELGDAFAETLDSLSSLDRDGIFMA